MNSSTFKIMVVDDDADIRYAIANILRKCDCEVSEAATVEESFEQLASKSFDVIFSDMRFHGGLGGEDLLEHVQEHFADIDVVLVSCAMDNRLQAELIAKGASCCLQKPFFRDTCMKVLADLGQDQRKAA